MEKLKRTKKKTTIQSAIAGAVVAVLGGLYFLADSMATDSGFELAQAQGEVIGIASQIAELERKHQIVKSSLLKYQEYNRHLQNGDYAIGREIAFNNLKILNDRYRIMKLMLGIPNDPTSLTDEKFQKKTLETKATDVNLTMSAFSDLHIFSFLSDMKGGLPGFFKYDEFSLQRDRRVTLDVLAEMSRGEKSSLVSCSLKGTWYGIFPKASELTPQGTTP